MSPYFKKTISFSINLKLFEKNNSYFTAQPKKMTIHHIYFD